MTVLTKPISGEKKEPLKTADHDLTNVVFINKTKKDGRDSSLGNNVNMMNDEMDELRARRATLISQTCLLLTGIVAMTMAFMGAVHLYRQLHAPNRFRGMCRIPYHRNVDTSSAMITGDFKTSLDERQFNPKLFLSPLMGNQQGQSVELDFELDIETNAFESLELPEISHGRYLHDFKVNKTAIIDPQDNRCFVMPLDRNEIKPPRNLVDILNKMKDGTYKLNVDKIRKNTRVVLPPITDLSDYGSFIREHCVDKKTYRLEEATGTRFIRSVSESNTPYVEFAGKHMIHYNIVNLGDI